MAVIITTSVNPFATPKAVRKRRALTTLPDQAKAKKRQPIAACPTAIHRYPTRSAIVPVTVSPPLIPHGRCAADGEGQAACEGAESHGGFLPDRMDSVCSRKFVLRYDHRDERVAGDG